MRHALIVSTVQRQWCTARGAVITSGDDALVDQLGLLVASVLASADDSVDWQGVDAWRTFGGLGTSDTFTLRCSDVNAARHAVDEIATPALLVAGRGVFAPNARTVAERDDCRLFAHADTLWLERCDGDVIDVVGFDGRLVRTGAGIGVELDNSEVELCLTVARSWNVVACRCADVFEPILGRLHALCGASDHGVQLTSAPL